MPKLLRPASLILRNLSIPKKMLLLAALLLTPLLIQTGFLVERIDEDIEVAEKELLGVEYHAELRKLLQLVPLYRGVNYAATQKQGEFRLRRQALLEQVEQVVEGIEQLDWRLGKQLDISERWMQIKSQWQILSSDRLSNVDEQFKKYTQLTDELLVTMGLVADNSGLVLEPNIEAYYLMTLIVSETPAMVNTVQILRGISVVSDESIGPFHAPTLVSVLRNQQSQLIKAQSKVLQENPELRKSVAPVIDRILLEVANLTRAALDDKQQLTTVQKFDQATVLVNSLFALYDLSSVELESLLSQRIERMKQVKIYALTGIAICLLIVLYLFTGFYRSLTHDLLALVKASKQIGAGQTDHRIDVEGRDELSTVAKGFNDMAIALEQSQQEVALAYRKLEELTKIDPLTGLPNRRSLDEVLAHEWQREMRSDSTLSVLMLDIDCFKQYNDIYGHAAGDECLRRVGQELSAIMKRGGDFVARYGGEEFIIISPDTRVEQASMLAETVRRSIEALFIRHEGSTVSDYVTVSIGVACMTPKKVAGDSKRLIERADKALYQAKNAGRNGYVVDANSRSVKVVGKIYPKQEADEK